jgi:chemotaxis protein methyltransferase CheR
MEPEATDPRRLALERILAERFGLELHRYSNALIGILLARLPAEVRGDDEATVAAIGAAFSVSETMFLRHPEQLAVLRELAPELPGAVRGEPLRVWSAGCASGEEAYSLSAVLGAAWSRGVKVIGTDLNPALIERARAATYRKWSLRGTTPESVSAWILMTDDRAVVREPVRARVELSVLNLMADPYPEDLDVILCRNVLLYFCPSAARAVLSKMAASLRPGGVLMLGPADPPVAEVAGLTQVRSGNVLYYRAEARPRERLEPPVEEQYKTPGPSRSREAARPEPGAEPAAEGGGEPSEDPDRLARALAEARSLADERAFDGALEVLRRVVEEHPFAAEPNALAAMIALDAGRPAVALSFARRACFLEPDEPVPRYLLGVSFAKLGELGAARGSLEIARADLARAGDLTRPLPCGEGLTGKQLRRLVDAYLAGP